MNCDNTDLTCQRYIYLSVTSPAVYDLKLLLLFIKSPPLSSKPITLPVIFFLPSESVTRLPKTAECWLSSEAIYLKPCRQKFP